MLSYFTPGANEEVEGLQFSILTKATNTARINRQLNRILGGEETALRDADGRIMYDSEGQTIHNLVKCLEIANEERTPRLQMQKFDNHAGIIDDGYGSKLTSDRNILKSFVKWSFPLYKTWLDDECLEEHNRIPQRKPLPAPDCECIDELVSLIRNTLAIERVSLHI
jgi:hypothetical protein